MRAILLYIIKNIFYRPALTVMLVAALALSSGVFCIAADFERQIMDEVVRDRLITLGNSTFHMTFDERSNVRFFRLSQLTANKDYNKDDFEYIIGGYTFTTVLSGGEIDFPVMVHSYRDTFNTKLSGEKVLQKFSDFEFIENRVTPLWFETDMIISKDMAEKLGAKLGDNITMLLGNTKKQMTVTGIANNSGFFGGSNVLVDYEGMLQTVSAYFPTSLPLNTFNTALFKLNDEQLSGFYMNMLKGISAYKDKAISLSLDYGQLRIENSLKISIYQAIAFLVIALMFVVVFFMAIHRLRGHDYAVKIIEEQGADRFTLGVALFSEVLFFGIVASLIGVAVISFALPAVSVLPAFLCIPLCAASYLLPVIFKVTKLKTEKFGGSGKDLKTASLRYPDIIDRSSQSAISGFFKSRIMRILLLAAAIALSILLAAVFSGIFLFVTIMLTIVCAIVMAEFLSYGLLKLFSGSVHKTKLAGSQETDTSNYRSTATGSANGGVDSLNNNCVAVQYNGSGGGCCNEDDTFNRRTVKACVRKNRRKTVGYDIAAAFAANSKDKTNSMFLVINAIIVALMVLILSYTPICNKLFDTSDAQYVVINIASASGDLAGELEADEGVERALAVYWKNKELLFESGDDSVYAHIIMTRQNNYGYAMDMLSIGGEVGALKTGMAVVSKDISKRLSLSVGDTINVPIGGGSYDIKVGAIANSSLINSFIIVEGSEIEAELRGRGARLPHNFIFLKLYEQTESETLTNIRAKYGLWNIAIVERSFIVEIVNSALKDFLPYLKLCLFIISCGSVAVIFLQLLIKRKGETLNRKILSECGASPFQLYRISAVSLFFSSLMSILFGFLLAAALGSIIKIYFSFLNASIAFDVLRNFPALLLIEALIISAYMLIHLLTHADK